ncbi:MULTISPECIES: hypothetical protein [Streptomyces]|uniref:hypothetical protein n=1 Tax=Streptomyces TaxID=1883 RepID=UPI0002EAC285|nr:MULTISPECIES: hypothetical protein [Streptomyces]
MVAAIAAAAVVVVALVVAGVVVLSGGGDDDKADDKPSPTVSESSTPPEELPSDDPADDPLDDPATEFPEDEPSDEPSSDPSNVPLPSWLLQEGDCFDLPDDDTGGKVLMRECDESHYGEVVKRVKIEGNYDTDSEVRKKASSLCEKPLRDKGNKQDPGKVSRTLVSYPKAAGVDSGINYVTCSLTAAEGKKLKEPLR